MLCGCAVGYVTCNQTLDAYAYAFTRPSCSRYRLSYKFPSLCSVADQAPADYQNDEVRAQFDYNAATNFTSFAATVRNNTIIFTKKDGGPLQLTAILPNGTFLLDHVTVPSSSGLSTDQTAAFADVGLSHRGTGRHLLFSETVCFWGGKLETVIIGFGGTIACGFLVLVTEGAALAILAALCGATLATIADTAGTALTNE